MTDNVGLLGSSEPLTPRWVFVFFFPFFTLAVVLWPLGAELKVWDLKTSYMNRAGVLTAN